MFNEEVQCGLALLDKERPDWRKQIDSAMLDMGVVYFCILGQIYDGGYDEGIDHLFRYDASVGERRAFAVAHGFDVPDQEDMALTYKELQKAWIVALEEDSDAK